MNAIFFYKFDVDRSAPALGSLRSEDLQKRGKDRRGACMEFLKDGVLRASQALAQHDHSAEEQEVFWISQTQTGGEHFLKSLFRHCAYLNCNEIRRSNFWAPLPRWITECCERIWRFRHCLNKQGEISKRAEWRENVVDPSQSAYPIWQDQIGDIPLILPSRKRKRRTKQSTTDTFVSILRAYQYYSRPLLHLPR